MVRCVARYALVFHVGGSKFNQGRIFIRGHSTIAHAKMYEEHAFVTHTHILLSLERL